MRFYDHLSKTEPFWLLLGHIHYTMYPSHFMLPFSEGFQVQSQIPHNLSR